MTEKDQTNEQNEILDAIAKEIELKNTEIQMLQNQVQELKDMLLRSAAEVENMRKRSEKQIDEAREYAIANFAKDLISVTDNLLRAAQHKPQEASQEVSNILQGIEMTISQLTSALEKHNVRQVEANIGDKFDYNNHQAISQIPTDQYPKGVIMDVMQVGYKIKDRLLRPAIVAISDDLPNKN